ncbi:MAG: hypothetical protein WC813_02335 [Patescibacteria group bacterium]|jgi:uncharacterized protein YicC (UPF0701 family)
MKNIFKKGLILGGILTAGAAIGFAMTKEGKDLSEDLQKDLKSIAKHLTKALHELEDVTQDKYNELVEKVVDEYAKDKALVIDARNSLVHTLQAKWHEMEAEYKADHKA